MLASIGGPQSIPRGNLRRSKTAAHEYDTANVTHDQVSRLRSLNAPLPALPSKPHPRPSRGSRGFTAHTLTKWRKEKRETPYRVLPTGAATDGTPVAQGTQETATQGTNNPQGPISSPRRLLSLREQVIPSETRYKRRENFSQALESDSDHSPRSFDHIIHIQDQLRRQKTSQQRLVQPIMRRGKYARGAGTPYAAGTVQPRSPPPNSYLSHPMKPPTDDECQAGLITPSSA